MLILLVAITLAFQSVIGENIKEGCYEGFVMDFYCINLGTLLDARSIVSLNEPNKHSLHCLVDVPRCVASNFEILAINPAGSDRLYGRAYVLDDKGKEMAIKVGKKVGEKGYCTTCEGAAGAPTHGFRATIHGKVDETGSPPFKFTVTNLTASPRFFKANASDGCTDENRIIPGALGGGGGDLQKPSLAHGSLMIISWGLMLPTGVASAKFLRHRPNALWFKMHRIMQIVGLIIAIAGWAIALSEFDVFDVQDKSFTHGALGMTVMVLGILQPINAFLRPHPAKEGESKPMKRLIWEIVHKASGYIAIILAAVTICYGTLVIFDHKKKFQAAWGCTIAWVVVFSLVSFWDGYRYSKRNAGSDVVKNQNTL